MSNKLTMKCDSCSGSGFYEGSECYLCSGRGYVVNPNYEPPEQLKTILSSAQYQMLNADEKDRYARYSGQGWVYYELVPLYKPLKNDLPVSKENLQTETVEQLAEIAYPDFEGELGSKNCGYTYNSLRDCQRTVYKYGYEAHARKINAELSAYKAAVAKLLPLCPNLQLSLDIEQILKPYKK